MCQVSSMRQGMMTLGPTPDSKCKLIISPFLTFPHLIDCLICTRNVMSVVLSLELMVGSAGLHWGCLIHIRVWMRQRGASYHLIVLGFFSFFLFLYFVVSFPQCIYLGG